MFEGSLLMFICADLQLLLRYEHSKLSDEKIAELVREGLAAVGLKVCQSEDYSEIN